jgi:hypothetical protein
MINPAQIPDEVVEAARREHTDGYAETWDERYRNTLAAALNAWPGVCVRTQFRPDPNQGWKHLKTELMLSLPLQDTHNAE